MTRIHHSIRRCETQSYDIRASASHLKQKIIKFNALLNDEDVLEEKFYDFKNKIFILFDSAVDYSKELDDHVYQISDCGKNPHLEDREKTYLTNSLETVKALQKSAKDIEIGIKNAVSGFLEGDDFEEAMDLIGDPYTHTDADEIYIRSDSFKENISNIKNLAVENRKKIDCYISTFKDLEADNPETNAHSMYYKG